MLEDSMTTNMRRTVTYGGVSFTLVLEGSDPANLIARHPVLYAGDRIGILLVREGTESVRATSDMSGDLRRFDQAGDRAGNEREALRWMLGEWLNRQTATADPNPALVGIDPLEPRGGQVIPDPRASAPPTAIPCDLTLRDWFAGQALNAMSAKDDGDYNPDDRRHGVPKREAEWIAIAAYRIADAMMAERAKQEGRA